MEIEIRQKITNENQSEELFNSDPQNIISPELLNNIGVLRLEQAE